MMATGNNARIAGRFVWHDLFTTDIRASRSFYAEVAGWRTIVEHATEFAWGGGAKDYVLALKGDEAGAGMIATGPNLVEAWVPYVEVWDVDAVAAVAAGSGGTVVRPPFDVPGVGRNCLLRDPLGAVLGISFSRHRFPPPTRIFSVERYVSQNGDFPAAFYRELFNWDALEKGTDPDGETGIISGDTTVALSSALSDLSPETPARWVPALCVERLDRALARATAAGASGLGSATHTGRDASAALIRDPTGILSCLEAAHGTPTFSEQT